MFITNFTQSVTRACIMGIIGVASNLFYKKQDTLTSISISLLISILLNPFVVLDIGLQLSYLGTLGIILFNKNIEDLLSKKINKKLAKILSVIFSAQIMIMPVTAYRFNSISLTFFISNFFVASILGIIIILGFITIFISFISFKLAKMLAVILNLFLEALNIIAKLVSKIPFGNILIITPYLISIVLIYLLFFVYYIIYNSRKKLRKKILKKINQKLFLIIILIIIILFNLISHILIPHNLKIYFVDVGQGDCSLIVTPNNKTILIDGGEEKNDLLTSYLLDRRIKKLDYIIISHFDSDHVGGVLKALEKLKIKNVIISKQKEDSENFKIFKNIVNRKKIKVIVVNKGDKLKIENDLYFDFLWPNKEEFIQENALNNNSIVCKLNYKNFSMLFTGDIEEIAEKEILKENNNLKSTILKIPHHGSKTSSSQEFIEAIKPKIILIGVGENNKFGHPNDEILERLEKIDSKIYRTDKMGEITITINRKFKVKIEKQINSRN